jgi:hypothetical protein
MNGNHVQLWIHLRVIDCEDDMEPKGSVNPIPLVPRIPPGPELAKELEIWDAPFERWLRMADDLLRKASKDHPGENRA